MESGKTAKGEIRGTLSGKKSQFKCEKSGQESRNSEPLEAAACQLKEAVVTALGTKQPSSAVRGERLLSNVRAQKLLEDFGVPIACNPL